MGCICSVCVWYGKTRPHFSKVGIGLFHVCVSCMCVVCNCSVRHVGMMSVVTVICEICVLVVREV